MRKNTFLTGGGFKIIMTGLYGHWGEARQTNMVVNKHIKECDTWGVNSSWDYWNDYSDTKTAKKEKSHFPRVDGEKKGRQTFQKAASEMRHWNIV